MIVEQHGNGENIVIGIHGWGGSERSFDPVLAYLPEDVTFYSWGLPGYSGTQAPADWSPESISTLLAKEVEAVATSPVTIIGHCSGAILGLMAADTCPEQVGRLVMLDAFAYKPWYFGMLLWRGFGPFFYYSTFGNPLGRYLTDGALRNKRAEDSHMTDSFKELDLAVTYKYLRLMGEVSSYKRYAHFRCPEIDIVYGVKSFDAIHRSVPMWKEIWPDAGVWPLQGGGHLPIHEATEELAKILFRR